MDNGTVSTNMEETKAISTELRSEIMNYVTPKDVGSQSCTLFFL